MFRLKIGLVLAGLLAMMAVSATPAFSFFESEAGKTQGKIASSEITSGGEFVYEAAKPAVAVKCPPKSVAIEWSLPAEKSATQTYTVKWGKECFIKVGTSQLKAAISNSELQVSSPEKGKDSYTQLKGTALNETVLKIEEEFCVIKVPSAGNKELTATEQKSPSLTSFEETIAVNTTSVTSSYKFKGVGCGLAATSTTGELKGVEFKIGKGQGQR
jgi:hypothetical protein